MNEELLEKGKIEIHSKWLEAYQFKASYELYGSAERREEKLETLAFVKENFDKLYEAFLEKLFSWQERCQFEIWNPEDDTFTPVWFITKEEAHPYLGKGMISIVEGIEKQYIAFEFYKENRLSMEHGLTVVFDGEEIVDMQCDDCFNMVYWLDHPDVEEG